MTSSTVYHPQTSHNLVHHLGGHELIQRYTAAAALDKPSGEVRSTLFIPSLGLLLGTEVVPGKNPCGFSPVVVPNGIDFPFLFSCFKTLYPHKVCMLPDLIVANAGLLPRFTTFLLLLSRALSGGRPCKPPCMAPPKHCQNQASCNDAVLPSMLVMVCSTVKSACSQHL